MNFALFVLVVVTARVLRQGESVVRPGEVPWFLGRALGLVRGEALVAGTRPPGRVRAGRERLRYVPDAPRRPRYSPDAPLGRRPRYSPDDPIRQQQTRDLEVFGPPGEWRARKNAREWREYADASAEEEEDAVAGPNTLQALASRESSDDFKTWRVEVAAKQPSFFAGAADFAALGASEEMQAALAHAGAARPSRVQAAGFGRIRAGEDVVLADQTGSGKTVAYLAPVVQALRDAEATGARTPPGQVAALVLTPTAELAQQVLRVAKDISAGGAAFRSAIITGEHKWATQKRCAENGLELLIATPGRLRAHLEADPPSFNLSALRHLVLDEADLLFEDEDFEDTWEALRSRLAASTATVFVTATLPSWLVTRVQQDLPLTKVLRGETLHRTAPGVRETIIDCSAGERVRDDGEAGFLRKGRALLSELAEQQADRVLVFCNTIESCRRVENFLRRKDRREELYRVHAFHKAIPADARKRALADFTQADDSTPRLLVCTDRASRGMDFRDVRHVILFDFPRDGVEYVRRVGRATRGTGTPGRVSSLVLGRQLAYARELMKLNRAGDPVDLEVHGGGKARDTGGKAEPSARPPSDF